MQQRPPIVRVHHSDGVPVAIDGQLRADLRASHFEFPIPRRPLESHLRERARLSVASAAAAALASAFASSVSATTISIATAAPSDWRERTVHAHEQLLAWWPMAERFGHHGYHISCP